MPDKNSMYMPFCRDFITKGAGKIPAPLKYRISKIEN